MHRIRMDERDLEPEHALPRSLVDQLGARVREVRKSRPDVVHLVRDVVHSRAPICEETADRRVLAERAEQLEPALPDADRRGLDALLLDPRTVLEPRPEQALVGLERSVEILDGETDVMHRARRLHAAIVFERLAPPMRVPILALVLAAVALSGCGSSKKAEKPNGEASKPPARVLADARVAATSASSAHVSGHLVSNGTPVTLDLTMARGKGAKGSASVNGLQFDAVRIGDTVYIHGSDDFYKHFAGAAVAQLLHGRWVKASTNQKQFRSFAPLTDIGALFTKLSKSHGKLVNAGETTYQGQQVVAIRDTSDGSKLYVAAAGKPYPVALVGGKKGQTGTIVFGDWNKPASLAPPKSAVDISQFGG
jgi:hypothetical protein